MSLFAFDRTPSPLPDHDCTHCYLLSWPPTQQMIDNSIEKGFFFFHFPYNEGIYASPWYRYFGVLLAEYLFYFMDERWKNKKIFFLSNFQPIHVLLQRLVQWQVENLSSCQVASFCRSIHKRQEKEHSEG